MSQSKPNLLFSPGPTLVSPRTLQILSEPTGHHRTSEFQAQFRQVLDLLKTLYQTQDGHVFCLTSTGTGAMEASVINFLNASEKVLYYNAGKFGERWGQLARCYGLETHELKQEWGQSFPLESFEQLLKTEKFSAFLLQACETSTATCQPLAEVSVLLKKYQPDCLLIVDGITAVGAYDLPMDQLGIDILVSGSQKALGLPTGLAFLGASPRALTKMVSVQQPRFYFDLRAEKKANDQDTTNFSTPVAQILALKFKLEFLFTQGLQKYFLKTQALQESTLNFLKDFGCRVYSQSPSPSLTAFSLPQGSPTEAFQKHLKADGLYLAGGQDHLKGHVLRWGHMGDILVQEQIEAYKIFASHIASLLSMTPSQSLELVDQHASRLQTQTLIDECYPQ